MPLTYRLTTYPHAIRLQTRLGTFSLAFYRNDTLAIGLPLAGRTPDRCSATGRCLIT